MNTLYFILAVSLNSRAILCTRTKRHAERPTSPTPYTRAPSTPGNCPFQSGSEHSTGCLKVRKSTLSPPPPLSFDLSAGGSFTTVCEEYVQGGEKFASRLLREFRYSDPGTMMVVREGLKKTLMEYAERQQPTAYDELRQYAKTKNIPLAKIAYKRVDLALLEALRIRRAFRIVHKIDKKLEKKGRGAKQPKDLIPSTNLVFSLVPSTTLSKACEGYIYLGNAHGRKVKDLLKGEEKSTLELVKESIKSIIRNYLILKEPLGAKEIIYYFTCKPEMKKNTYKMAKRALANVQRLRRAFQLYHLIKVRLSVSPSIST